MTQLKAGLVVPTQYLVNDQDLLTDAMTGSVMGYPVYYGGVIYGWLDSSGNVLVGEASPAGGISVGSFGGYDPERPPPGYDPVCWRGTNWDYNHGLTCRVVGANTVLETDLRMWTPWTWDLGQNAPPAICAYSWAVAQGLSFPHPGPLTLEQAQKLLGAVQTNPNMTVNEYLATVQAIKGTPAPPPPTAAPGSAPPTVSGPIPPGPSTPTGGVLTITPATPTMLPPAGIGVATPQVPLIPQEAPPTYIPPPLTVAGGAAGSGAASGTTGTPTTAPIVPEGPRMAGTALLGSVPVWAWLLLGAGALFLLVRGQDGS